MVLKHSIKGKYTSLIIRIVIFWRGQYCCGAMMVRWRRARVTAV